MLNRKAYICGKITGDSDYPAKFERAEQEAASLLPGYVIINPTKLPHQHGGSWEEYMAEDLEALADCDMVVLIPDWSDSRGARLEYRFARQAGLPMLHLPKQQQHIAKRNRQKPNNIRAKNIE